MGFYFLESSAAVKLNIPERGTSWLQRVLDQSRGDGILLARIAVAEIAAAIIRRARSGAPTMAQAFSAIQVLRLDLQKTFGVVEVTETIVDDAVHMALRHGLRGYDCIQLAAALFVQRQRASVGLEPAILISADRELNAAARVEGLSVEDPNTHP